MSRLVYDPISRELINSKPRGVEIPVEAYSVYEPSPIYYPQRTTSAFLTALLVVLIIVLIFLLIYLTWVVFVKTADQKPSAFFSFLLPKKA